MQATGHAPLLTEFGATTDVPTITAMVDRAELAMTGWQFWAYCGCDDPTTTGPGDEQALVLDPARKPTRTNVDLNKLRALVIPHPLRVAGHAAALPLRPLHPDLPGRVVDGAGRRPRPVPARQPHDARRTEARLPARVRRDGHRWSVVSRPGARVLVVKQAKGAKAVEVVVRAR